MNDAYAGIKAGGPLNYARVGGPPENWNRVKVTDLDTGEEVHDVIEVDATAGWLIRYALDEDGQKYVDDTGRAAATEKITGRFGLTYREPSST